MEGVPEWPFRTSLTRALGEQLPAVPRMGARNEMESGGLCAPRHVVGGPELKKTINNLLKAHKVELLCAESQTF